MLLSAYDEDIFYKQCTAIEKYVYPLEKSDELEDIDDSKIQLYICEGSQIKVINSIYICTQSTNDRGERAYLIITLYQ